MPRKNEGSVVIAGRRLVMEKGVLMISLPSRGTSFEGGAIAIERDLDFLMKNWGRIKRKFSLSPEFLIERLDRDGVWPSQLATAYKQDQALLVSLFSRPLTASWQMGLAHSLRKRFPHYIDRSLTAEACEQKNIRLKNQLFSLSIQFDNEELADFLLSQAHVFFHRAERFSSRHRSYLHFAVQMNAVKFIRLRLVAKDKFIYSEDSRGRSPFALAYYENNHQVVKLFTNEFPNLAWSDRSLAIKLVKAGDLEALKRFKPEAVLSVSLRDIKCSVIYAALKYQQQNVIDYFVDFYQRAMATQGWVRLRRILAANLVAKGRGGLLALLDVSAARYNKAAMARCEKRLKKTAAATPLKKAMVLLTYYVAPVSTFCFFSKKTKSHLAEVSELLAGEVADLNALSTKLTKLFASTGEMPDSQLLEICAYINAHLQAAPSPSLRSPLTPPTA